jgi:molybdate transport system substrate-binding protein
MGMRWWARAAIVVVALAACGPDGGDDDALLVFAAASLTDALAEVEAAFEQAEPGVDVRLNLAGSSTLREQILAGAPADVFVSADVANVATLVAEGAADGESTVVATNELQLVVPAANEAGVAGIEDLADPDLLVGLCAPEVPCGALALDVLREAGVDPAADTEEPDVRALLAKVVDGELDAGIVYRSDVVAAGDAVRGIDLPGSGPVAEYAAVAVDADDEVAAAFVAYLTGAGRAILAEHGFGPPP